MYACGLRISEAATVLISAGRDDTTIHDRGGI